jgi:hypothetical protein
MAILSKPASTTYSALAYITIGTLTCVWSGVWLWYLSEFPPQGRYPWYFSSGFLLSGLALLIIGLAVGQIGRAARSAELPPAEVTPAIARADQMAAQNPGMPIPVVAGAVRETAPLRQGDPEFVSMAASAPIVNARYQ